MTLVKHELKQNLKVFLIWTGVIAFLIIACIFMYPDMKDEMGDVSDMFGSMGSFTQAFGMDKINFGTLSGFYAIECGNIVGLGGAFFASLVAISVLSNEERDGTAEFLLTNPISRVRVISEKLIAVVIQIVALNICVFLFSWISILIIGEKMPLSQFSLLHLAFLLSQLELAGICFGISAFIKKGSLGIGLGISTVLYFLNIIANLTKNAKFIKYITPFGYTDGADIVSSNSLDGLAIGIGLVFLVLGIILAYYQYMKKDIK